MPRPLRTFTVLPHLPARLLGLQKLAYNLWWCWNQEAISWSRKSDRNHIRCHGFVMGSHGIFRQGVVVLALLLTASDVPGNPPKGGPEPILLVVMDPLAKELACACVKGYGQRDYRKLAARLEKVSARIFPGGTPRSSSTPTRAISVRVLPVPGPASISTGPASTVAAASCH